MSDEQPRNPLHGITLKTILEDLVDRRGFDGLAMRVKIRCFAHEPSIKSSLKFLRKNDWARAEVEQLYLADQRRIESNKKRNRRRAEMRAHRAAQEVTAAPEAEGSTELAD